MRTLQAMTKSRTSLCLIVAIVAASLGASGFVLRGRTREVEPLAVLTRAAGALDYRLAEGRLSHAFEYREIWVERAGTLDLSAVRHAAVELRLQWEREGTPEAGRRAGVALLVAGDAAHASATLVTVLQRAARERDPVRAVARCDDPNLLTDLSAAVLQSAAATGRVHDLVLAFEAADRAWRLDRNASAGWNRALAAERLGAFVAAAHAWEEEVALDRLSSWSPEGRTRLAAAVRLAQAALPESIEAFFHRQLTARAISLLEGGASPAPTEILHSSRLDPIRGDHLASDTLAAVLRIRRDGAAADRARLASALAAYTRARDAFEDDALEDARRQFERVESELRAFDVPLAWLARDQRIRSGCSQAARPGCLDDLESFRADLLSLGRYPWLAARTACARGQALFRRGRIFEAAEWLQKGQDELRRLNDPALESLTATMLANAYAAAGETDVALEQHLTAIRRRAAQNGDRRRRQVEDAIVFALRHGFVGTAGLLLDELRPLPSTAAGLVLESTLRGVLAGRRGDPSAATRHFERSHELLAAVRNPDAHADVRRSLAIAESELQLLLPGSDLAQLDDAVAEHEHEEFSIWLPILLVKRGAVLEARNDPARAEADYRRAIEIVEQREPRIDQSVLSLGVAVEQDSPFDRLIRLLMRQQRTAAALSIAQRASVLRISSLHARSEGLRDVFGAARGAAADDGIAGTQRLLRNGEVAAVQYLLRDELITWIVTPGAIRAIRQPVRAQDLAAAIDALRTCAHRGGCDGETTLEMASDLLLRGWIASAPRSATLLIQPPHELQAIPLAMLKTSEGETLLARNALTTTPSLHAFVRAAALDARRARGGVSAFFAAASRPGAGHASLPLAESEVTRSSRFYEHAEVDLHTTRASFLQRSPAFSVIHFAGHALVNVEQPLRSALVFEPSGEESGSALLPVYELVERSFATARLIVLTGCETGRASRPAMSLAGALLSQGVPSVVYTLWPVDDEAAEEFAVAFHRAVAAGRGRAEAVREAQLSMLRGHPNRPGWWAAFALAGAPGPITDKRQEEQDGK
jgi:tetratricopeptide (TPR) repeat protein